MTVIGLHHFNLRAPEAEIAVLLQFYCEVLDFKVGPRPSFKSKGEWLYANDIPTLHLTEMNSGEVVAPGAPSDLPAIEDRFSSVDHIALACSDLDAALQQLRKFNVAFTQTVVPAVGEVQIFLRDPSGNGIELIFDVGIG